MLGFVHTFYYSRQFFTSIFTMYQDKNLFFLHKKLPFKEKELKTVVLTDAYIFFTTYFSSLRIQDIIDISLVAYVVYKGMNIMKETRAAQLISGLFLMVVMLPVSDMIGLNTVSYILKNTMQMGILAVLIVFQPELRRALEQIGRSRFGRMFSFDDMSVAHVLEPEILASEICEAARYLSGAKIGALIVMEKRTKLGDIIRTGVNLNASVSAELLVNIFIPNTPLHDGGIVIRGDKIMAAACLLPLTANQNLNTELGTRHRAALGLSEISDAQILVISEETGKISIASNGELKRNLTIEALRRTILKSMEAEQNDKNSILKKISELNTKTKNKKQLP